MFAQQWAALQIEAAKTRVASDKFDDGAVNQRIRIGDAERVEPGGNRGVGV